MTFQDPAVSHRDMAPPRRRRGNSTGFGRRPNPVFSDEYGVIREALIRARSSAGISQRELAKRLGKTPSHVARVEAGQRRLDTLELWKIAKCLCTDASELFDLMVLELELMSTARSG